MVVSLDRFAPGFPKTQTFHPLHTDLVEFLAALMQDLVEVFWAFPFLRSRMLL
jgi:hypothetical protein